MNEQHFSPSTRRRHYVKAIEELTRRLSYDELNAYALCILLGTIAYEDFFNSPWTDFTDLNRYYPELTKPSIPICQQERYERVAAIEERIGILQNAIKKLENEN